MKQNEVIELISKIEKALEAHREVTYFHSCGQHLFTVKAIYGKFLVVIPVDKSPNFSVSLTNPDIKKDQFVFESDL